MIKIIGYTVGNHVLWLRSRVTVKLNFRQYIRRYISPNEKFEYSYPLINMTALKFATSFSTSGSGLLVHGWIVTLKGLPSAPSSPISLLVLPLPE